MEKKPLISVAMTTYNGEKYLSEQLDSIFNQTYKNIELIVCDDCSTDSTVEVLEKYAQKYPNMKVFENEHNLGFIKNFEKAISLCSGDYIALSDQDDIWYEDKLEILLSEIDNNNLICSRGDSIDKEGKYLPSREGVIKAYEFANKIQFNKTSFIKLYFINIVGGATTLAKKDFLLKCLPLPENIYHDKWMGLSAFCDSSLKFLNKSTFKHRKHDNNASIKNDNQNRYLNWIKKVIDGTVKNYVIENKENIEILKKRLNLKKEYFDSLDELTDIYDSILNFRWTLKDFKLLYIQYKYYKIAGFSNRSFFKTVIDRLL